MANLPEPLQNLIDAFERLPGIGPKTAARLAFFILNTPEPMVKGLVESLQAVKQDLGFCQTCFNITLAINPLCEICSDARRNQGVGPDDLKIQPLMERVRTGEIMEVILATNPSMEGDATALYLHQRLTLLGIKVTRLARGLPVGSVLEYADQGTLSRALAGRQDMTS
jgi:recombination protein RecR